MVNYDYYGEQNEHLNYGGLLRFADHTGKLYPALYEVVRGDESRWLFVESRVKKPRWISGPPSRYLPLKEIPLFDNAELAEILSLLHSCGVQSVLAKTWDSSEDERDEVSVDLEFPYDFTWSEAFCALGHNSAEKPQGATPPKPVVPEHYGTW